jgi:hypothetical protein
MTGSQCAVITLAAVADDRLIGFFCNNDIAAIVKAKKDGTLHEPERVTE